MTKQQLWHLIEQYRQSGGREEHWRNRDILDLAIEAAVVAKLAAVNVEPCAWEVETEQQDGTRAKWVSTDRKRHREFCDFGEPRQLYSQEAIAAARAQENERCAQAVEAGILGHGECADMIRALIGGGDA